MRTAMEPDWYDEDFLLWEADLEFDDTNLERIADQEICAAIGRYAVWEGSLTFLPYQLPNTEA